MLGIFRKMMPREDKFFVLFDRHAAITLNAARELELMLKAGHVPAPSSNTAAADPTDKTKALIVQYGQAVIDLEHEADDVTREVMEATRRSFITPFDRSDIKDLIQSMDDAVDTMQKTVKSVFLYERFSFDDKMVEMGEIIVKTAILVADLVPLLEKPAANAARITDLAEQVKVLEERSDRLQEKGLKDVYSRVAHRSEATPADVMAFIVEGRIYDQLEKVVDSLEDVADEVSAIMIENV
jgi:predicted phosphate transport protein (TIGR00153 family)